MGNDKKVEEGKNKPKKEYVPKECPIRHGTHKCSDTCHWAWKDDDGYPVCAMNILTNATRGLVSVLTDLIKVIATLGVSKPKLQIFKSLKDKDGKPIIGG